MKKNIMILMVLAGLLTLMVSSVFADEIVIDIDNLRTIDMGMPVVDFGYLDLPKVEKYATFLTLATFEGVLQHRCMGLTTLCPDLCGHSGNLAVFSIDKNLAYGRFHEYGDTRSELFHVLIKNTISDIPLVPQNIYDQITSLKNGDKVLLSWNHNYVTINGSSAPQRPINFIYPLTESQAGMINEITVLPPVADTSAKLMKYSVFVGRYEGIADSTADNAGNSVATFWISKPVYTFYLADFMTLAFQFRQTFDVDKIDQRIVNDIKGLEVGSFALVAYRVDNFFAGDQVLAEVTTPLFVLPIPGYVPGPDDMAIIDFLVL